MDSIKGVWSEETETNYQFWKPTNPYYGRWFSVLGDSISTMTGFHPSGYRVFFDEEKCRKSGIRGVTDTWWGKVIDFVGGRLLINNSWSGSRVTGLPGSDTLFPSGCSDERTSLLHAVDENGVKITPDVIILYLGTNDWANGVPIYGQESGAGSDSGFHSAYRIMLEKIHRNYPKAQIWCCSLMATYISKNREFQFPPCYAGVYIEDFNTSIRKNAEDFRSRIGCGVRFLDLYSYHLPYDTLDGSHPNRVGMDEIARLILRETVNADGQTFLDCPTGTHEYAELGLYNRFTEYMCRKCGRKSLIKTQWSEKKTETDSDLTEKKRKVEGLILGGKYQIAEQVGAGGCVKTYCGYQMDSGERCAIKAIFAGDLNKFAIANLENPLRLMSELRHPGLRVIKDLYEDEGFIFEIMERIEGGTLFSCVRRREHPVSIGEIVNIANQMAEILLYLHSLNPPVILRSFEPEDWVLDHDGNIHLINFGSAMRYFPAEKDRDKLYPDEQYRADIGGYTDIYYGSGVRRGYKAPEVFSGQSEPVSDVYSFGATLYYLVTGQDPSKPPYRILPLREANPSLQKDIYNLEFVIGKCTKPNLRERYQNYSEILQDLYTCEHMTGLHGWRKWRARQKMKQKTK